MAAAEQLAPLVEADAKEAEQLSRQTDRVVAALRKAGIADEIVAECGRVLLGITGPTAYWTLFAARGSLYQSASVFDNAARGEEQPSGKGLLAEPYRA
jgi:hypothetical protein